DIDVDDIRIARALYTQRQVEVRSAAAGKLQSEIAAHQARKPARDEQAKPRAAAAAIGRPLFERGKDRLDGVAGYSGPGVDDADEHVDAPVAGFAGSERRRHAAGV